jgi:hypothetical protein
MTTSIGKILAAVALVSAIGGVYAAPVYAPPPVVYVPAPSVGVHLFFPLFR